jgi:hypothetical protein
MVTLLKELVPASNQHDVLNMYSMKKLLITPAIRLTGNVPAKARQMISKRDILIYKIYGATENMVSVPEDRVNQFSRLQRQSLGFEEWECINLRLKNGP